MADQPAPPPKDDRQASPLRSKTIRSHKISTTSPSSPSSDPGLASAPVSLPTSASHTDNVELIPPLPRSHTPGHLASKSQTSRRKQSTSDTSRQRAASSAASAPLNASLTTSPNGPPPVSIRTTSARDSSDAATDSPPGKRNDSLGRRPNAQRSTSAIVHKAAGSAVSSVISNPGGDKTAAAAAAGPNGVARTAAHRSSANTTTTSSKRASVPPYTAFPPLASPTTQPEVPAAPASGMYWSRAPVSGHAHPALRAHTTTSVGANIYVFGGCDSKACFNDLYVLDGDAFHWSRPQVSGDIPVPLRAMTCTAVGKKLVIFGGGDGPAYYNEVYVLDTVNFRWTKPRILGDRVPSKRRAHTACFYKNGIYVFGGGDGVRALNDIWRLDVSDLSKMSWKQVSAPSEIGTSGTNLKPSASSIKSAVAGVVGVGSGKDLRPKPRGYHTANIVDGKLIIFGGSDGGECFNDVWVYDIETHVWKVAPVSGVFRRLSHTATIVGSFLFIIGGHDGNEYSNDVLLLDLSQMVWSKRRVYGLLPSGRGYHGTVLQDSRLVTIGGFDGGEVFGDVWILELAVHAYYSQISQFNIEL